MLGCPVLQMAIQPAIEFTLFDTAIGRCGIAWNDRGLVGVQLPEAADEDTRGRVLRRFPGRAGGPTDRRTSGRRRRPSSQLLRGRPSDLSAIVLDMEGVPAFHRRVYQAARDDPARTDAVLRGPRPAGGRRRDRPGRSGRRWGATRSPSSSPATGCWRREARWAASRPTGASTTKLRMLAIEGAQTAAPTGEAEAARPGAAAAELHRRRHAGLRSELGVAHIRKVEPALGRVIDAVGSFDLRVDPAHSLFSALARAIVYQQLSGKAAATIFAPGEGAVPGRASCWGRSTSCRPTDAAAARGGPVALEAAVAAGSGAPDGGRASCRRWPRSSAWTTRRSSTS